MMGEKSEEAKEKFYDERVSAGLNKYVQIYSLDNSLKNCLGKNKV